MKGKRLKEKYNKSNKNRLGIKKCLKNIKWNRKN